MYLVESGEYSDYHIHCIFSNKDDAYTYAADKNEEHQQYYLDEDELNEAMHYNSAYLYSVSEWEIDNEKFIPNNREKFCIYEITIQYDGKIKNIQCNGNITYLKNTTIRNFSNHLEIICSAKSQEHAIKIANDLRRRIKAES